MSGTTRGAMAAASLLGVLGGFAAVGGTPIATYKPPRKTHKRRAYTTGGFAPGGVKPGFIEVEVDGPSPLEVRLIDAAQAKRERKAAKREREREVCTFCGTRHGGAKK